MGTGAGNLNFTSPVTPGNLIVVFWSAGSGTFGITIPTSLTDNNSNVYDQVSFTYTGAPNSGAVSSLYVCSNPILTPHTAPTISSSGYTGVPTGGPSIVIMEFGVPSAYTLYGSTCANINNVASYYFFDAGQLNGVGVSDTITLSCSGFNQCNAMVALILQNQFNDLLVIYGDYDSTNNTDTWTTSGTIIAQTIETQAGTNGRTAVICSKPYVYSTMVCGYSGPIATCNNPPNGKVGVFYTTTLGVSGGTAPYNWVITAGTLPPGLSLNATTGTISGTPTTAGSWWFTATVTDATALTSSCTCSIGICTGGSSNLVFYSRH